MDISSTKIVNSCLVKRVVSLNHDMAGFFRSNRNGVDQTMTIVHNHQPQQFKNFSQFNDLADFNQQFEMWAADIKRVIPKRQYNFITALKRFMAKVPGISTAKYNTVVIAANEKFNMPTSRRTAERIMPILHRFGIVKMFDTKMQCTNIRGANIIVWQRYDAKKAAAFVDYFKNGGTGEIAETVENVDKVSSTANDDKKQNGGTLNCFTKALKIKLLNTLHTRKPIIKTVTNCLRLKNTAPITNPVTRNPLLFVSRLKTVVYKSLLNTKKHAEDIKRMVYGKVNKACKIPFIQPHQKTLLERSLRIVDTCLTAHKTGQLTSINNMQAFISSCLDNEIKAFIDLHIEAENNASTYYSAFNSGDFYDWSLD